MLLLILAWLYLYALGFIMKLTHSGKEELGFRDGVGEQGMALPPLVLMQVPSERVRPCWMAPAVSWSSSFFLLNHGRISGGQGGNEIMKGGK